MKVLRGRSWVTDLNVVFCAQLQEALHACRRMLGALAFVTVWQEQDQAVLLAPLVFGSNDVLVDDDLCAVGEVAELGFPHHKCFVVGVRITIFETNCCVFGK